MLAPFLSFYGSKYKRARRYPDPRHDIVIEPFAGGAGYSIRHHHKQVILFEKDPQVAAVWRYLIRSSPDDIRRLPLLGLHQTVDDLQCCPDGRLLIRWWTGPAGNGPRKKFGSMARKNLAAGSTPSFWSQDCRERLASQVGHIKHWIIIEGDYTEAPDIEATWFVDPPYNNKAGRNYKFHSLDYDALGQWCTTRRGQVIVCENEGATWLPFRPLYATANNWNGDVKRSTEVVWP